MTGASMVPDKKEIRNALSKAGLSRIDNSILDKCVTLASTHHLSAVQMAECWEAFALNKNVTELTDHTFQSYRNELIKDAEVSVDVGAVQTRPVKRQATNMVTPPAPKRQQNSSSPSPSPVDFVAQDSTNVSSPRRPNAPVRTPILHPVRKYHERNNVGQVVASYNPKKLVSAGTSVSRSSNRCVIDTSAFSEVNIQEPYRHMFTTLEEKAQALQEHLETMGQKIADHYGIGDGNNGIAPLGEVNAPQQDVICCVGRICNEAHDGKLNYTSVVLEGSSTTCGGARINVDLSKLKETKTPYCLFPGQIVAIEGMNPTGRKLVATRIFEGVIYPPNTNSIKKLREFHYDRQDGKPLSIFTASGPFTARDNMEYQPFVDLMMDVKEKAPDVVILTGPFVDVQQPLVQEGKPTMEIDGVWQVVSYEALFAHKISGIMEYIISESEDLHTQFVLVPSLEDATARWVYPQPPFQDRLSDPPALDIPGGGFVDSIGSLGLGQLDRFSKRVHRLSNPCTFKINEVVFGVSSTDVLFHVSAQETNMNLETGSRLRRIAQHMLEQQSYYPLFPPSADTNLDLKRMKNWQLPCKPDVLILPSKLKAFATVILENTVVINPGHLTRGTTGGTYASIEIHPIGRDQLDQSGGDEVQLPHGVEDRVIVEVKNI